MKKKVKLIVLAVLCTVVAAAVAASYMAPMEVSCVTVEPKEAHVYFTEDGTVTEGTDFALYPEVSGVVKDVPVKKGDYVNEGDVILEIDSSDYERQFAAHEAAIAGYKAQIDTALNSEANTKDEYMASLNSLRSQLGQIEAQRKIAQAARETAATVSEQQSVLQITIDKLKGDVSLYEDNVQKLTQLYEGGVVPKAELEKAQNDLEAAVSQLKLTETEYRQVSQRTEASDLAEAGDEEYYSAQAASVRAQIDALSQNLGKDYSSASIRYYSSLIDAETEAMESVRDKLLKCIIKAPVSGYISELPAESASAITQQQYVAIIKTKGQIKIEAYVSTKDVGSIAVGGQVDIVLKGREADKVFSGKIETISSWAESRLTALGLNEKKVRTMIEVEGETSGCELISGADVDVMFTVYREQNKLLVPSGAIFSSGGKDYVFTVPDGKAVKTEITKGPKTLMETVVEKGLRNGDKVISEANTEGLKEGVRIK